MIEDQYLPYFITEPIYQVSGPEPETPGAKIQENVVHEPEVEQPVAPPPPKTEPVAEKVYELAIWTPPLTNQDRELLTNILKAIQKDFSTAYLMEGINSYKPHFKTLLCFGYQKELGLEAGKAVPLYQPANIDGRTFLTSAAPADLHEDKKQKALLWGALQQVFL